MLKVDLCIKVVALIKITTVESWKHLQRVKAQTYLSQIVTNIEIDVTKIREIVSVSLNFKQNCLSIFVRLPS